MTDRKANKPHCYVTDLTRDPEAFAGACAEIEKLAKKIGTYDLVVSPSGGPGSIFGTAVAVTHGRGLVAVARAGEPIPGKEIHYATVKRDDEEAETFSIAKDAIRLGQRVLIIDDVLASGNTALTLASIVKELGGTVTGIIALAEVTSRGGRRLLEQQGHEVRSVLCYP